MAVTSCNCCKNMKIPTEGKELSIEQCHNSPRKFDFRRQTKIIFGSEKNLSFVKVTYPRYEMKNVSQKSNVKTTIEIFFFDTLSDAVTLRWRWHVGICIAVNAAAQAECPKAAVATRRRRRRRCRRRLSQISSRQRTGRT